MQIYPGGTFDAKRAKILILKQINKSLQFNFESTIVKVCRCTSYYYSGSYYVQSNL